MSQVVDCPECGSVNYEPLHYVEAVFQCLDCGFYFEDPTFSLDFVRENRERNQEWE